MRTLVVLAMLAGCSAPDDVDRRTAPPRTSDPPAPIEHDGAPPTAPRTCGTAGATTPPSRVAQIVAGTMHACARLADASVWCWGARGYGLIDGDVMGPRPCPIATRVDELAGATRLVGDCALRADNTMRCGDVERGQFDKPIPSPDTVRSGDEEIVTPSCRRRGTTVSCTDGPGDVLDVAAGQGLECVVQRTGIVWCKDEHARDPMKPRGTPPEFKRVDGVHDAKQIAVGERHACVLSGSDVVCWGNNACGQAGADTMSAERCGSPDVPPTTIRWAK